MNQVRWVVSAALILSLPMIANAAIAPEIDGSSAGMAMTMLGGVVALLAGKRRNRSK